MNESTTNESRMLRRTVHVLAALALGVTVLAVGAGSASALTNYTVTSTVDGDPGSLRALLDLANSDGDDSEIALPAGSTLTLDLCEQPAIDEDGNADGDLDILTDGDLTITGNGATIEQTCAGQRVVHSLSTATTSLYDVTITGGDVTVGIGGGNGGGVALAAPGTLIIGRSTITGNSAFNVGGGVLAYDLGGDPILFVGDSTVSDNSARIGGGLFGVATETIVNTTISGNEVVEEGGAMNMSDADLIYVTVTDNDAGADATNGQFGSPANMWGVAIGPSRDGGPNCSNLAAATSFGQNVSSDDSCDLLDPTDVQSTDPLLGPLADNGGPTLTHLPQAGSPLLDHIPVPDCDATWVADQRNIARPQGTGCDVGSVEVEVAQPPTTTTTALPTTTAPPAALVTPAFTG